MNPWYPALACGGYAWVLTGACIATALERQEIWPMVAGVFAALCAVACIADFYFVVDTWTGHMINVWVPLAGGILAIAMVTALLEIRRRARDARTRASDEKREARAKKIGGDRWSTGDP